MPDDIVPKGSASAQASAEAAAGASEIIGAATELPPPTPDAAEPEAPAAAEPADGTPATPAEGEEEGGDYNPEEAEAALAAADEAAALPPEHRKLLETHKTPAALAKALYDLQQQVARGAKPPAPAAAPAPGTVAATPPAPAAPPPPITREQVESTIQSLAQSDPNVSTFVREVQGHAAEYTDASRQFADIVTKIDASKQSIIGRTHLVEFLTEQVKANPEDFRYKEQLQENRVALADMKAAHQELLWNRQEQASRMKQAFDAYEEGRRTVYAHAQNVLAETNARGMEDAARDSVKARTAQEWSSAFPRVMDTLKIPANKRNAAEKFLLQAAFANPQDISNIEAWMMTQGREIADFIGEVRAESVTAYRRDKKADATQPAPRGPAAVVKEAGSPGKPEPRLSSKEASRLAGEGFTRSLRVGAR